MELFFFIYPQAQLQDAKRRWEELQNFLHSVNAEREKLQASKQGEKSCRSHQPYLRKFKAHKKINMVCAGWVQNFTVSC